MESSLNAVVKQAEALLAEAGRHPGAKGIPLLQQRLERALRQVSSRAEDQPVTVALIGGTGAGKSELFNALLRSPGASPVSDAERLFTKRPHVAAAAGDAQRVVLPELAKPVWVASAIAGVALIDTPDLDGVLPENREQARLAIEAADILVYVALPEKRASFEISKELQQWTARKQWFFALNKVDLYRPEELGMIRSDFSNRIAELGFVPSDATLFLISARERNHPYSELERLRSAIYSGRAREEVRALHAAGVLRALAYATGEEVCRPLIAFQEALAAAEADLTGRTQEVYRRAFSENSTREALSEMVRARVWRQAPARVGGFLAVPLWIWARLNQLWLAFSLSRMAAGRMPGWSLVQAIWMAGIAYLRGILPLHGVLAGLKRRDVDELRQVRLDGIRKLEDLGWIWEEAQAAASDGKKTSAAAPSPWAEWFWEKFLVSGTAADPERAKVFSCVMEAVERSSAEGAVRAVGAVHRIFGNLLPLMVFVDVARKAVVHWMNDAWLPGNFYWMAFFLFAVSTVPGCLLVGAGIRSRAGISSAEELVGALEAPDETRPVRSVREEMEIFGKRVMQLRRAAEEQLGAIAAELEPGRFGAGAERSGSEAKTLLQL